MFRTAILFLFLPLLLLAEDESGLKEFKAELKEGFKPLNDTMRGQQLVQLADACASDDEFKQKMVPYVIYSLLQQEIHNLENSEYDDESMEKMRMETLEKLYEAIKNYVKYSNMSNLLKELK